MLLVNTVTGIQTKTHIPWRAASFVIVHFDEKLTQVFGRVYLLEYGFVVGLWRIFISIRLSESQKFFTAILGLIEHLLIVVKRNTRQGEQKHNQESSEDR